MLQLTIVCRGWCTAKPLASVLQNASQPSAARLANFGRPARQKSIRDDRHGQPDCTERPPRASPRLGSDWKTLLTTMPQTPRRNSQTTPNWADQLSANRYAAGAAVAALLAAYVLAGPTTTERPPNARAPHASRPPGARGRCVAPRPRLCGNQIYGVFVHAIDATPARWRGDVGSSPLDGASAATYLQPDTLVDFHTDRRLRRHRVEVLALREAKVRHLAAAPLAIE